ncbi:MAG: DUF4013 domain-containing protein [Coriobacteriales bacterium]|nr:DUF4013 domain-containing protein [Coriobacteriales bacterium]
MDIGRAFNAPFKDREWLKKTALGGLLFIVPILQWVVYGALIKYIKRVTAGSDELPDWGDDFGGMFKDGFFVFLAGVIFALPAIVIMIIAILPIIGAALSTGADSDAAGALISGAGGLACLLYLVAIVYIIFVSIYLYAAIAHYAMRGTFGAFFEFGEVMGKMRAPGAGFWTAWLMSIVFTWAAGFAGGIANGILSIIPFLGSIAGFYLMGCVYYLAAMMSGNLFGQYSVKAYGLTPAMPSVPSAPSAQSPYAPPPPPSAAPPAPPAPPASTPQAPPATTPPAPPAAAPPAPPAPPSEPTPPAPPAPPAPPSDQG